MSNDIHNNAEFAESLARHKDGYAMPRYFYQSPDVYALEQQNILFKSWILVGHGSQISTAGDFLQFEIAGESLIVCRDKSEHIQVLLNVCRHRGARVCEAKSGNARAFTCPYHGWVYDLDGALKKAREFEQLDERTHGLHRLRCIEFHGLIFVNFDPNAADFEPELALIEAPLAGFDLANAKVAESRTYTVKANWKLALENYLECYHCATAHRAYSRSHTLKAPDADVASLNTAMLAACETKTGIANIGLESYHAFDQAKTRGGGVDCSRYALYDGYLTGSENGNPVAPLMGQYQGYDGGAGDFQFGPLSFMLGYPDHCVVYLFTPRAASLTDMTVLWMVRNDAVAGQDYRLDELTWLWHHTTQEDEFIIRRNAAGVASQFFEPGPYHPEKEALCIAFTRWYFDCLKQ